MQKPIVILGAGGHAAVVAGLLIDDNTSLRGVVTPSEEAGPFELDWLGDAPPPANDVDLANGIGAADVAGIDHRAGEFQHYLDSGYNFPALVHPHAWIGREVTIGAGAQVMAGAIVQPYGEIGRNVILNSGALIDHHSRIEDHAHIAPGAVLCGNVTIGKGAMVGAGAVILPGATVPAGELVKAASRYPK